MTMKISRRHALAGGILAIPAVTSLANATGAPRSEFETQLAALEARHPGRIGVAAMNLVTGRRVGHRQDERFLMCSTFKALVAAFILFRVDRGEEQLDRVVTYSRDDLVTHSPITEKRVETGMTVAELCQATVTLSDNAAVNLLLKSFGGPAALTRFERELGDTVTRHDRYELELNVHDGPEDQRDTSTPSAMLDTLRKLVFEDVLSPSSKAQLAAWLIMNKTGDARLRAGFPKSWLVGDKTGGNGDRYGNANDIAVAWRPEGGATVVIAFCEIPGIAGKEREAVLAEIGRIVAAI